MASLLSSSSSTKVVKKRRPNQNKKGPIVSALAADHYDSQNENDDNDKNKPIVPKLRDTVLDDNRLERLQTKGQGQLVSFFEAVDARMELVATPTYNHRQLHPRNHTNTEQQQSTRQHMVQTTNNDTNNNKTTSSTYTYKSIFDELPFLLSENNKNSIFDIFPKQANDTPTNADAFDRNSFQEYESVIEQIFSNTKFTSTNKAKDIEQIKIWLHKPDRQIPYHLPTLIQATTSTWNGEAMPMQPTTTTTTTNPIVPHQLSNDNTIFDNNTTTIITTKFENSTNKKQQQKKNSSYKTTRASRQLHTELKDQKKRFLQSTNLTAAQYDLASNVLCQLGEFCAKMALLTPLEVAWEKIKEAGMIPKEHYMSTFLYVVGNSGCSFLLFDTDGSGSLATGRRRNSIDGTTTSTTPILHILGLQEHSLDGDTGFSTIKEASTESQQQQQPDDDIYVVDLPAEVATFHDLLYEPTEKSISLRVKHLVANGNASAGEALLDYMQDIVDKKSGSSEATAAAADGNSFKLRTYLPVLRAYCDEGNCSAVLKLFTRMRNSPGVVLEPGKFLFFFSPNVRQSDVVVT